MPVCQTHLGPSPLCGTTAPASPAHCCKANLEGPDPLANASEHLVTVTNAPTEVMRSQRSVVGGAASCAGDHAIQSCDAGFSRVSRENHALLGNGSNLTY